MEYVRFGSTRLKVSRLCLGTMTYGSKQWRHEQDFAIVDRITQVARKRGVKNTQVAMAWILQQPGITAPILGASKPGTWRKRWRR